MTWVTLSCHHARGLEQMKLNEPGNQKSKPADFPPVGEAPEAIFSHTPGLKEGLLDNSEFSAETT